MMGRFIRLICLLLALVAGGVLTLPGFGPAAVHAQQGAPSTPDYERWSTVATRAEEAIETSRASTAALETLREELVDWRQQFQDAQTSESSVISTVRSQLEALGPTPEDGQESADIAQQRETLNARLADLQAPVKRAELAHSRADGLIKGIDQIIRDRQTDELLEFGPSPVNPVHLADGASALFNSGHVLHSEFLSAWSNPTQYDEAKENLPVVAVLLIVGVILVLRGRRWSKRLTRRILKDKPGAGRWIAGFFVSLGSLFLPYAGIFAITEAAYATGLVGLRTDQLLSALLRASFVFLLARWLATRIFPADDLRVPPLNLDSDERTAGRWYAATLGLVMVIYMLLREAAGFMGWAEAASNAILFPVMVASALLLWRLARLLYQHALNSTDEQSDETFRARIARLLSRVLLVLAVVAPALAAVGYFKAAQSLMLPSLFSLLLLAALLVLQRFVVELYVLLSGNREGAADSLIPVLIGFVLIILSMPFFALIWGARVADLTELWTQFVEGVTIGDTRISPTIFLTLAIVFGIGFVVTRLLQGALKNSVLPKTKIDPGGRNAIVSGVGYVGIFLAALIAITSAGIDLSSLAIVAGALSVGIGFGLQNIVSNFVSGIILLIERPISEGDWIEVGGQHGTVKDISVRSTRIETFDRTDVIVPNADFVSGTVTNYTRGNTVGRVIVPVGVAYGTDTRKVEDILLAIGEAHPLVLANPAPYVVFQGFGASSMDFEIRAILRDVNFVLNVKSDMNHEIARRFAEEGIEIPFAQQDIWLRNPEAFGAQSSRSASPEASAHIHEGDFSDVDPDADPDCDGGDV
jgi:small-conductance mechanosensitive channel